MLNKDEKKVMAKGKIDVARFKLNEIRIERERVVVQLSRLELELDVLEYKHIRGNMEEENSIAVNKYIIEKLQQELVNLSRDTTMYSKLIENYNKELEETEL